MIELFKRTQLSANLIRELPQIEAQAQVLDCIVRTSLAAGVKFHKAGTGNAQIQAATMVEQATQIAENFKDFSPEQIYEAFSMAINGKLPYCTKFDVPNNYAKVFTHYREHKAFQAATKMPQIKEDSERTKALNEAAIAQMKAEYKAFLKAFKKALKGGSKPQDMYHQLLGGHISEIKMALWYDNLIELRIFRASKTLKIWAESVAYNVTLNKIMNPTAYREIGYSVKQAIKESYPAHIHQILKDNSSTQIKVYLFRANVEPDFKEWLELQYFLINKQNDQNISTK